MNNQQGYNQENPNQSQTIHSTLLQMRPDQYNRPSISHSSYIYGHNFSVPPPQPLPNFSMPSTISFTSFQQKKLNDFQKKNIELEEQLKDQQEEYIKKIQQEKKKSQQTVDGLQKKIKDLEDDVFDLKIEISKKQSDNNFKQQTIDKITKEKKNIQIQQEELQTQLQDIQIKYDILKRKIDINPNPAPNAQFDLTISEQYEKQIKKYREEIKNLKDDLNNQTQTLKDEQNNTKNELENQIKQNDKEHQYFMEARDEIAKLQKVIKQKDEKNKQIYNEKMNAFDAFKQANMDIQRLEDNLKQKDFEIESLNLQIKLLQDLIHLLKNLLNESSQGQKVSIEQNQSYQELLNQQKRLIEKKNQEEEKLRQEYISKEQDRKDKIEKDRKRKEEARLLKEQRLGIQLQQGNQVMQQAKKEYGQLDVCFIVDVTGSMDSYKEQTKRSVQGSLKIIKQATNRDTNWASVCYQDKAELKNLGKYYEFPFSKDQQALEQWFDNIKCSGGGDAAEDIRGAIKQVCQLNWPSRFRIAIIICDAPCHGRKYNGGCGDNHPDEDIQDAIEELIEKNIVLIALNFTKYTTVMYEEFKKIYESKKRLDLFLFQDLQKTDQAQMANTMAKYIGEASQNATQTNKNQTKSKQGAIKQDIPREKEGAMEALCQKGNFYKFEDQPDVKTVKTKFEVWKVEIKDEEFQKNIETIENIKCPQDFSKTHEGTWDCIRTEKPFAFGMMKDVFLMKKLNANTDELYVIKTPIGSQPYKTMDDALNECKSHLICQKLMKRFVNELQEQKVEKEKNVQIPLVIYSDFLILEESKNSFWIAERFFKGEFVKYNNNYGFILEDYQLQLNKFAQSFTYYTYFTSHFHYMVADVQGVGNYFTDPAINTISGNFDDTDMGKEGQKMYLVNYENKKSLLTYEYLDLLGIYV